MVEMFLDNFVFDGILSLWVVGYNIVHPASQICGQHLLVPIRFVGLSTEYRKGNDNDKYVSGFHIDRC
jgi:hypothetical protein